MSHPAIADVLGFLEALGEPLLGYDAAMSPQFANSAARVLAEAGLLNDLPERLSRLMISRTPAIFEYSAGTRRFEVRAYPTPENGVAVILRELVSEDPLNYRRMLEAVMDNIPLGITIADAPDVRVRSISRHGAELTGISREGIEGVPYQGHGSGPDIKLLHADGVTPAEPKELPLTRATRNGEVVRGEEWIIDKQGQRTWLRCDATPILNTDGSIAGGVLAFSDITASKLFDDAMHRGAERLRLAQRAARCGTWDWNIETGAVDWSDEYHEIYGGERRVQPSFASWILSVHPDDRDHVQAAIAAALAERTDLRVEFRPIEVGRADWYELIGSTMTGHHGKPVRLLGIVLDITERKRIEQELSDAVTSLKSSNEDLQKFAYVVSHDLQEPLRMVRSFAQLLGRRGKVDEEGTEFLGFIDAGVDRMQLLIRDLLEYSRISYGPRRPLTLTNFNYTVRLAMEHLKSAINESGAEFTIHPLPSVMANDGRMLQVFQNLIGNAIKYRGVDPLRISISAERNGDEWVFSVGDNGIGIESAYYERIFGVFQRLHGRDQYEGTGIGLAIVRRVIEQHQGRIWLESKVGSGSTFFFSLPAAT